MNTKKSNQSFDIQDDFIYGINGLATFLRISKASARKIKPNLPSYQFGPRMIRFKKSEVLSAMSSTPQPAE
jgi:hypothetical protein